MDTNSDKILVLIEIDRHRTTEEIEEILRINHSTVSRRLDQLGMTIKADVRIPQELTKINAQDTIFACHFLLKRNKIDPIFKRIVTGDEKWIEYNND